MRLRTDAGFPAVRRKRPNRPLLKKNLLGAGGELAVSVEVEVVVVMVVVVGGGAGGGYNVETRCCESPHLVTRPRL